MLIQLQFNLIYFKQLHIVVPVKHDTTIGINGIM